MTSSNQKVQYLDTKHTALPASLHLLLLPAGTQENGGLGSSLEGLSSSVCQQTEWVLSPVNILNSESRLPTNIRAEECPGLR